MSSMFYIGKERSRFRDKMNSVRDKYRRKGSVTQQLRKFMKDVKNKWTNEIKPPHIFLYLNILLFLFVIPIRYIFFIKLVRFILIFFCGTYFIQNLVIFLYECNVTKFMDLMEEIEKYEKKKIICGKNRKLELLMEEQYCKIACITKSIFSTYYMFMNCVFSLYFENNSMNLNETELNFNSTITRTVDRTVDRNVDKHVDKHVDKNVDRTVNDASADRNVNDASVDVGNKNQRSNQSETYNNIRNSVLCCNIRKWNILKDSYLYIFPSLFYLEDKLCYIEKENKRKMCKHIKILFKKKYKKEYDLMKTKLDRHELSDILYQLLHDVLKKVLDFLHFFVFLLVSAFYLIEGYIYLSACSHVWKNKDFEFVLKDDCADSTYITEQKKKVLYLLAESIQLFQSNYENIHIYKQTEQKLHDSLNLISSLKRTVPKEKKENGNLKTTDNKYVQKESTDLTYINSEQKNCIQKIEEKEKRSVAGTNVEYSSPSWHTYIPESLEKQEKNNKSLNNIEEQTIDTYNIYCYENVEENSVANSFNAHKSLSHYNMEIEEEEEEEEEEAEEEEEEKDSLLKNKKESLINSTKSKRDKISRDKISRDKISRDKNVWSVNNSQERKKNCVGNLLNELKRKINNKKEYTYIQRNLCYDPEKNTYFIKHAEQFYQTNESFTTEPTEPVEPTESTDQAEQTEQSQYKQTENKKTKSVSDKSTVNEIGMTEMCISDNFKLLNNINNDSNNDSNIDSNNDSTTGINNNIGISNYINNDSNDSNNADELGGGTVNPLNKNGISFIEENDFQQSDKNDINQLDSKTDDEINNLSSIENITEFKNNVAMSVLRKGVA